MSVSSETEPPEAHGAYGERAGESRLAGEPGGESLWGRLWRFRWVLLVVCLAAGSAGAAVSFLRGDTYTATLSMFLEPTAFEVAADRQSDPARHISTQAGLIQSGVVLNRVSAFSRPHSPLLGPPIDPQLIPPREGRPGARDHRAVVDREAVSAQPDVDGNEIIVSATARSPQAAARMLGRIVGVYREVIGTEVQLQVERALKAGEVASSEDELDLRARAAAYGDGVRFVEPQPQLSADGPGPVTLAALAAISALFLGASVLAAPVIK